jgi:hypothetical protein
LQQLAASNWQLAKQKQAQKQKQNLTADYADKRDFHRFFGVVFFVSFA